MTALLEKLLPVLIILTVGWILRKKNIISAESVGELKQLIVNVALPCILFLSFSKTTLEARYILIVVFVFAICLSMYGFGFLLRSRLPGMFGSLFTPWFMSGFEFGMIGIGLFATVSNMLNFFKGKTIAQLEDWVAKYTTTAGRPIKATTTNPDDLAKYNKLTDKEKADLADVTSGATMSLRDAHGDYIGALGEAYKNRHEVTIN